MQHRVIRLLLGIVFSGMLASGCGGGGRSGVASPAGPQIEKIALTPTPFSTGVGIARQLTALATYSDGTTSDVTARATWKSSASNVATVAAGLVTGVSIGSATVSVEVGSIAQDLQLSVTVDMWTGAAPLPVAVSGHTATALLNGKVLVVGGVPTGTVNPTYATEIYDPSADAWTSGPATQVSRDGHTATLLRSGKVLIVGGLDQGQLTTTVEIYDPSDNSLINTAPSVCPHVGAVVTELSNGKVLVAGGVQDDIHNTCVSSVPNAELYNASPSNSWEPAGEMLTNRLYGETGTLLPDGRFLVAGGVNDNQQMVAAAEIYDPASNSWAPAGNMVVPATNQTATLMGDGTVLFTGGTGSAGFLAVAQVYDPVTNSWSQTASMSTARAMHTATLLPNGKLLIAGGQNGGSPLAASETYDPATHSWSTAASMSTGRASHAAVLLPSGIVFTTGGLSTNNNPTASSELYW